MKLKSILIIVLAAMALHGRAQLTVNISNISMLQGELYIAVYDDAERFLNVELAAEKKIVEITGETASVVISGLKAGKYSVAVFQDLNGNGTLDMKKGRIPDEPFGFSNNARGKFGPPGFNKASFSFCDTGEIDIKMVNNER